MSTPVVQPRLYSEFASWWPLLSAKEDYAQEAAFFTKVLLDACRPATVLELGCGGGCNAYHMKAHFALTLTDASERMLAVSRAINPECEHVRGDMRALRLGRTYDAVFVHDAVMYMASREDLAAAAATARAHLDRGGCALFVPDWVEETFTPGVAHGGHDGSARALRYLEWTHRPHPETASYVMDFVYLLREADGSVRAEHDRHTLGLFPRSAWLETLEQEGFRPTIARDAYGRELFVCGAVDRPRRRS